MGIHITHERGLPAPEERQQILEQAGTVLARARALMARLDQVEVKLDWGAHEKLPGILYLDLVRPR